VITKLAGLLASLVFCASAAAATYDDPWSPATEQAANAAVAALGSNAAHALVPTIRAVAIQSHDVTGQTHEIVGLVSGVANATHDVQGKVQDLAAAKRDLGAQETEIEVRVELPADVLFDFDKADIRADAAHALAELAAVIRAYKGAVRLEGHTDAKGAPKYNQNLSERRAASVMQWLIEREQVPAARMTTQGFGKTKPVASNDTDAGRQKNRRVEVVIRKK
jgi:outer membrane protein OmpA-like peptidoglycan-associated protein